MARLDGSPFQPSQHFCFSCKRFAKFSVKKCRKSWLAQGSSGRRVTLLPGTTFLHINGASVFVSHVNGSVVRKCRKSWLGQGSSGRRLTLLPGTTFLHINGAVGPIYIWRKVVPGKRVTLPAESASASVYMRKKLTPFPEPTALAHALIVSH